MNFLLFNFLNVFFISNIILYDSLINLNFFCYFFLFSKKILIGKKFNQKSIFKKTLYLNYIISLKKFKIFSRLKCGDINFFSRINNELIFVNSYKIFFLIFTGSSVSLNSINIINYFLTYRFNFSNILFIIYLNNLNIFKIFNCFLNKTIIYYMINNNIFYLLNYFFYFNLYYLFFSEFSGFYNENSYFFNFYDLKLNILINFLSYKSPKYLIINNFFNFINLFNFFIFLY
ncbi:MAG: hypothetical protein ACSHUF_00330 [Candidatus Nasuia deltocephalinicola]